MGCATGKGVLCSFTTGADVLLRDLPGATALMGDKGYDSNKLRTMLREQGIRPCIPPKRNRNQPIHSSKRLYTMGHKVENLFAKLAKHKDWCPIATRYNHCASIFRFVILLAATIILIMRPPPPHGKGWQASTRATAEFPLPSFRQSSPTPKPGQGHSPLVFLSGTRVTLAAPAELRAL